MSAEEQSNSDRAQQLFDRVATDIVAAEAKVSEPAQGSATQGQEAPAETSTRDGTSPTDAGVTPGEQKKEPEVRRHVEIPFSRATYENLDRLRELGLKPTYRPEGNFWSGELSLSERRELHRLGVRTSCMVWVEIPGDYWTFQVKDQLKESGLFWDRASESWVGPQDVEDLESLARFGYQIGFRVYADGEDLTREYRREEYRARRKAPTFAPDRATILGLNEEVLEKEAQRFAKLARQSFMLLSGETRQEIGRLQADLRIPTDPETAELAWTELRRIDAGDTRAIVGAPAPAAYSLSSAWVPCLGRSLSGITSDWSTGKGWTAWQPPTWRSPPVGWTISTRRQVSRKRTWLRPRGGSTTRWPGTTSLPSATGDFGKPLQRRGGFTVPGGESPLSLPQGSEGASHLKQVNAMTHLQFETGPVFPGGMSQPGNGAGLKTDTRIGRRAGWVSIAHQGFKFPSPRLPAVSQLGVMVPPSRLPDQKE